MGVTQARRPGAQTGFCWRGLGVQEGRLRWCGGTDIIRERVLTGAGKPVQPRGTGAGESLSQTPVMVGEAACRYPRLGVVVNLAEGSWGFRVAQEGMEAGGVKTIADSFFAGAFHGT